VTNNTKQLSILASPLQRIAEASEASASILMQINAVVISLSTYAIDTVKELLKVY
jgi:hypothetical protein